MPKAMKTENMNIIITITTLSTLSISGTYIY
jgi:hypothetical protein